MLCAGSVRAKNAMNIMLTNVVDAVVGSLSYYLFGFAFAFGDSNPFIGTNFFALKDIPSSSYDYSFFLYQWAFAIAVAGITSGGVVHLVGGIAGFEDQIIEGPRVGRFDDLVLIGLLRQILVPTHVWSTKITGGTLGCNGCLQWVLGGLLQSPQVAQWLNHGLQLCVGLFAKEEFVLQAYNSGKTQTIRPSGLILGGGWGLFGAQIVQLLSIIVWVSLTMGPLFYLLQKLGILRISADREVAGGSISSHGGYTYDASQEEESDL
ncbi:hypothetical protein HAX54_013322 [Datura stramonium]|uniref:Ammonium transporter AmtB-like domain-containing protein n=1 Tax=Datura stramonium TaxID=4076 RepID=A0ABS8RJ43_DATST|nr:hypothetical protein [Datura stramonium]